MAGIITARARIFSRRLKLCILTIRDELVNIGERYYIRATAKLVDVEGAGYIENTAYARETLQRAKMDDSQITGACSSYARKYALNGLFLIDDVKDADATNTHGKEETPRASAKQIEVIKNIVDADKLPNLMEYYKIKSLEELTVAQATEIISKKSKGGK